jgi:glycosyltransferase involved in cell wall biosynthesis
MRIGIEASRANRPVKTGVEWYAWHVMNEMMALPEAARHEFVLYTQESLRWPPKYLWTQIRLSWEMLRHPPDVLFVPAHVLPVISPKKSVVTIHDVGFKRFPELYKKIQVAYHEITTRDIVRRGARIITVSEFCKREIVELYGAKPENIFVTHLGFDHERYHSQVADRKAQSAKPYILFVGRIDKKKNLLTLVRAFEQVAEAFPDLELKLAGTFSGPAWLATTGSGELMEAIQKSKVASRIQMLGYVSEDEKPALLSNALMYVQPSIYEGFGLPPLEAMACGTPTICANSTSLPEIVGEGNALFFDPMDVGELASRITQLASSEALRSELIQKGLEWSKRYDWKKTAAETLKILETW